MSDLRYPIGKYEMPKTVSAEERVGYVQAIAELPRDLRLALSGLNDVRLDTPYRPGGWTVRQVVHHLADSHMNSYIRFKLALTEDVPVIRPYMEERWAELPEAKSGPVELSLQLLDALHRRWSVFLQAFTPDDYMRTLVHPELGVFRLEQLLALYAWHGRHHVAHITELRKREGW